MDTGQPEARLGAEPEPATMPMALTKAAHRPPEGGSTLVLDADGQSVVVVLDEGGGDARLMWAFIRQLLSGRKAMRM